MALQLIDGGAEPSGDGDEANKTARLPRWTRQEILVLIQGKRVAENRLNRSAEPKWASISSYCKIHGVNRGPVQCRKRWSNLAGDFKKIREWESRVRDDTESFWVMRNDLRRERKLPGFFDREVYDILDRDEDGGVVGGGGGLSLAVKGDEEEAAEALFDSGRSAAMDDALFSDFEESGRSKEFPDTQCPSVSQETPGQGTNHAKAKEAVPEAEVQNARAEKKRKRSANEGDEETANLEHQLIEAIEKNGKLLSSQLEAQNTNLQLDREQRNDHVNGLITVINKLADALGRIAEKL